MTIEISDSIADRAAVYRALGDESRLAIVDALWSGDRTATQLQELTGLRSNLLAFHLDVLARAGLISRRASEGDGRRRYVTLQPAATPYVGPVARLAVECVLFVCTHNAARSQMAAAMWRRRTNGAAVSAGTQPAAQVHPHAVTVAAAHGLDLSRARPRDIADVDIVPDLVVSVCDRANEAGVRFDVARRHWSIPDPIDGDRQTFETAYDAIAARIERLAMQTAA